MQLNLGSKIRELRHRDNRTQETLADALGVTSQAVSRWESGGSYPDMELMPAIANYFGISIDELFGYRSDRDKKIDSIIERIDAFHIKGRSDDEWVDECLTILREGLAEFPQNERLLITLADTLSEAGWRRYSEWTYYDDEGYICHDYDKHRKNEYWTESIKICENLINTVSDNIIVTKAIYILVSLYRNLGENEKAMAYAERMPEMKNSRELLLAAATDGKEKSAYIGNALLQIAGIFAHQIVYGLIANKHNYESDMPIHKIEGAIKVFHLICDDENFGEYNGILIELYLYLSRIQWERGYKDEAFISLDKALEYAKALEQHLDDKEHYFTAPLVSLVKCKSGSPTKIAENLPDDWPMWCVPDCSQVKAEIKADPRWDLWVEKTKQ